MIWAQQDGTCRRFNSCIDGSSYMSEVHVACMRADHPFGLDFPLGCSKVPRQIGSEGLLVRRIKSSGHSSFSEHHSLGPRISAAGRKPQRPPIPTQEGLKRVNGTRPVQDPVLSL